MLPILVLCPGLISLCLLSSICKYRPISTKLGQNMYDHKIPNEFDYGSNCIIGLVYPLASTNINQSAPNMVKMYMTIRSEMSLIRPDW